MSMKELGVVGRNVGQRDLESHARGQTTYYEDVHYPRMLHLKMHRSAEPHARIVSVDTSAAEASPGVVCVLTHEDLVASNNCFFAATGITDGDLLKGVHFGPSTASSQSLVMRSRSGTVRLINTRHHGPGPGTAD